METAEHLIYIDDLTGLYNRRYLYAHLPKELQAAEGGNYRLWLFMLDIDNFKSINDTYGHLSGDEIIKEMAEIIKQNTKTDDKKIRYAGDEFTIILPGLEAKNVVAVGERLLAKISSHTFKDKRSGKEIRLTMSLGAAGYPQDSAKPIELISLADKALYVSKQKGKNCVSTASEITPELFWKKDLLDRFPCAILVERDAEISRLKEILEKVLVPKAQVCLISGELGIGKTRLLCEFESIVASTQSAICLDARMQEKFLSQPYYVVGEALYKCISGWDKLPEGILQGFSDTEITALAEVMPILKNIPGFPEIKEVAFEQSESLLPALIKFFQNIAKIKPVCLFFDDFQYVDQRSLEMLFSLIEQNEDLPLFILATYSSQEIAATEAGSFPFASVINTEVFQKLSQSLVLKPLSQEGVKGMIAHIFPAGGLSSDFATLVYKITRGNPLFVQELLKYLIEKEYIVYEKGRLLQKEFGEKDLPLSIEETIKKRIEDLNAETKEMITKAALIGDDFGVDLLHKIDSEDKGYVLDLIEAAKKIGLVYESGDVGKDEFSFVTGEIRKVLSKLISDSQKKQLHSRLGEIKENLYANNLSTIAGELYYNFKKAEDWVRAEQYAKIIKEGKVTFRERTARFTEALLTEAEEEKRTLPLSKKVMAIIPDIIRYNYIASVNCVLYPKASKMRQQPVEEIHRRLSEVFLETDVLTIAHFQDNLIINNKKLASQQRSFFLDGFISLLKNLGIESISFEKGLNLEELSKFIEFINGPQKKEEEDLARALENSGISHIKINQISFDLSKKTKEKESLQEMMLIDYLLGKLSPEGQAADLTRNISTHAEEIASTLEKLAEQVSKESGKDKESAKAELMAKSIQKIGSQFIKKGKRDWSKYKEGLAKTIFSLDPNLQANILAHPLEPAQKEEEPQKDRESVDVIRELSYYIPDEPIVSVLTNQFLEKDTDLKKMQQLVKRFLSSAEKKKRLKPVLKKKFIELGASVEECDWILEEDAWDKLTWEEKADKIITMPVKNLFRLLSLINPAVLIKELLSAEKDVLAEAVIEKLFSLLGREFPQSEGLSDCFSSISDIFIQNSNRKLLPKFIKKLIGASSEKEEFFFAVINPHLDNTIDLLLKEERFGLLEAIIKFYTKDTNTMERFGKILEPMMVKLTEEFIRRIDENLNWEELAEVLVLFKDRIGPPLIEEALFEKGVESGKYFEAYLRRCLIGKVLSRLPKEGLLGILKERFSAPEVWVVRNLIELVRVMEDDTVTKILEIPLKHQDVSIRRKTIFALSKLKNPVSTELLGEALSDTNGTLRTHALNALKDRNDETSLKILKEHGEI